MGGGGGGAKGLTVLKVISRFRHLHVPRKLTVADWRVFRTALRILSHAANFVIK